MNICVIVNIFVEIEILLGGQRDGEQRHQKMSNHLLHGDPGSRHSHRNHHRHRAGRSPHPHRWSHARLVGWLSKSLFH